MARKRTSRKGVTGTPPAEADRLPLLGGAERARVMNRITRLLHSREFESLDEVNDFLATVLRDGLPATLPPMSPLERAQDLVYDAWSADPRRAKALAKQSIALSPDCAEAFALLATFEERPDRALALLDEAVAAGQRAAPEGIGTPEGPPPWLTVESRPWMAALRQRSELLWAMGDRRRALDEARSLLALNPDDHQGVRYQLLLWLMQAGSVAEVEATLAAHDDATATCRYSLALHRFRTEGSTRRAGAALARALAGNARVPSFLLGEVALPDARPESWGFGDVNEAALYAEDAGLLWAAEPRAVRWLEVAWERARQGARRGPK